LQENDAVNLQALEEEEDIEGTIQARSVGIEDQAAIRYHIEDAMQQQTPMVEEFVIADAGRGSTVEADSDEYQTTEGGGGADSANKVVMMNGNADIPQHKNGTEKP
jgi:hypothetical protein